jgi:Bacterial Ig domain
MRTTLERALRRCDDYVWLYFENENWNTPGEIAQDWVDAVVAAKAAAAKPPTSPPPSVSITNPMVGSVFNKAVIIPITANASVADRSITKVEFFDGTERLGEAVRAPYSFSWAGATVGAHTLTAKATDNSGATTTSSQVPIAVSAGFSANINFQIAGVTPPIGYFADNGEVFGRRGNGLTYGWNVGHAANARNRGDSADLRLLTLCQFQSGGVWQLAVPNGVYNVTVGIGDGGYPSTYTINVEGVNYWHAQLLSAGQFINQTHVVNVSDGNLTIDQGTGGFEETRINYVLVAAATAPPPAPSGLTANTPSANTVDLNWADNSSVEVGFKLERSTRADFAVATELVTVGTDVTSFRDASASRGVTYYYRVHAFNAAGSSANSNAPSAALPTSIQP